MKILIITQYYYPENFKSNDLSFELQKRGHEVTVLTGLPNYPEGTVYKGYGIFKNRMQTVKGVKVIRSLLLPRGKGGGLRLFINYFSFAFFASIKAVLRSFSNRYDAIIVHEPSPITQYYPALLLNKIQNTPVYFWVLDLWPESLEVAGGIKNKIVLNIFKKMVVSFYNNAEKILISSKGFKNSILEKGDYKDKLVYFPNWAEESIADAASDVNIPVLPQGFKVMFAGNIGEAQDMESIMEAALLLKETKNIHWIIIGDGRKMPFLQAFIEQNELQDTVHLMGRHPVEKMSSFFSKADMMLVSLKDDPIFNLTVPAKMQAYMSAAKPILAMVNGEAQDIIKEASAGISVPAGSYTELAAAVKGAAALPEVELEAMGYNGRRFFEEHFTLSKCIDHLEITLKKHV